MVCVIKYNGITKIYSSAEDTMLLILSLTYSIKKEYIIK